MDPRAFRSYPIRFVVILSAAAVLFIAEREASGAPSRVAVAWNDPGSGTGRLRAFVAEAPWSFATLELEIGGGATLRVAGGLLYVVSRTDGTVSVIDPQAWGIIDSFPVGAGCEPVDIAVIAPDHTYVSCANGTHLLRLDPTTGATAAVVDLSGFADSDGIPDMNMMALHEGHLFVQVQRWNAATFTLERPAMIAVVDVATEQLVDADPVAPGTQAIELVGRAPKHKMQIVDQTRRLFVSATGEFFDEGGIEMVDLDTLQSLGLVVREIDNLVGADLGPFVLVTPERGFLSFSTDLAISSHLEDFTVAGGAGLPPGLGETVGYATPTLPFDAASDTWFFPDGASIPPRVNVFAATDGRHLGTVELPAGAWPTDAVVISAAAAIPATSTWGVVTFALLLLAIGTGVLRRRPAGARYSA